MCFFFQAEDGIRDFHVTGVQTCALPISWRAGAKTWRRLKNNGGSYLSSHDPREVLGIGNGEKIDELTIQWPAPSKRIDKFANLTPNRYIRIVEGKGIL